MGEQRQDQLPTVARAAPTSGIEYKRYTLIDANERPGIQAAIEGDPLRTSVSDRATVAIVTPLLHLGVDVGPVGFGTARPANTSRLTEHPAAHAERIRRPQNITDFRHRQPLCWHRSTLVTARKTEPLIRMSIGALFPPLSQAVRNNHHLGVRLGPDFAPLRT